MTETTFSEFDTIMVLDTETSGLSFEGDEIIEFSCVLLKRSQGQWTTLREYDELVQLSPGRRLDPAITRLTGITEQDLAERGIPKEQLCRDLEEMLRGKVLIVAYNAHFDLSFLFWLLHRQGMAQCLCNKDKLDLLTVFKDRREYPHKLKNAIEAYGLGDRVVNSHRAIDDVKATVEVMYAMIREDDDLDCYLNLMGYNPRYGVHGKRIKSVRYVPQGYNREGKLYQQFACSGDR